MSRTSIEVAPAGVAVPDVVAKGSTHELLSIRPSLQSSIQPSVDNISAYDGISLHSLERTETITSKSRTVVIIASVTLITAISTLLNGLTTVALPTIADELHIPDGVLLWPSSIQALTCGCTLLLSGSVADVLGARFMYLLGCVLQAGFILGCGLSRTATQIIVFRGLSGIAISCCLPSAVSIITKSFDGRRRNMAFAAMGGGQPVGFSVGLALGGVLTDTIGWRWGFYSAAIFNSVVFAIALWGLPKSVDQPQDAEGSTAATWSQKLQQLKNEIDWVGALIASSLLAMFSYVFASLTGSVTQIRQPSTIAILVTAFLLIPTFIFWVGRQEKLGKPAIIPNSLWRNQIFTIICISVFFIWGAFNAFETILTFYFQRVQLLTAIQSSLRFLPAPVAGAVANIAMGLLVHRVPANWLAVIGCTISAAAPLVMVFATPQSSYWSSGECFRLKASVLVRPYANVFLSLPRKRLQSGRRRFALHHLKPSNHICLPC